MHDIIAAVSEDGSLRSRPVTDGGLDFEYYRSISVGGGPRSCT